MHARLVFMLSQRLQRPPQRQAYTLGYKQRGLPLNILQAPDASVLTSLKEARKHLQGP